jgi:1-aminocyclopropane-1-carboxylate deaminase/D-cysteine desulfhydrase-like pyridoxal-dependent ACC family enzyme
MSEQPPLFRRYPALAEAVPWLSLGRFPTPLEPLPLAGEGETWVKRDDLSGGPYGGNKVRKLEFLLADALRAGAGRLITAGALGSHHALATAVYGRQLGLRVTLVLFPQLVTSHVRDVLLAAAAAGAEFRFVPRMELVPGALLALRWATRSERGYVIPPGGSNALGTLGYVNAALELAEQLAAGAAPVPREIHVAAGTLGTAAGLAIGLELAGLASRVAATRITGRIVTNERALARLVRGALVLLQPVVRFDPDAATRRVEIRHRQIGSGYGRETPASRAATSRFESLGLRLDPTYTAKAAAELLASPGAGPRLFWHTLSAVEPPRAAGPDIEQALPPRIRELLDAA